MKSSCFQEIQPERDVSGDNFSKGQINFNWTMDSSGYFNPYKTFIKIRFKLFRRASSADENLEVSGNMAVNMFLADNLFQSVKMNINNICVSETNDYVPQVASLRRRMYESEEHMNNYLASTNYSQASVTDRLDVTASRRFFECIWRPGLGFFDIDEYIPCCQGLFNLQLTPQPNVIFQRSAIESNRSTSATPVFDENAVATGAGTYIFKIESMNMYIMKGIGTPFTDKTLNLQFRDIRCQSQNLTTNSLHQKTFQVSPRTKELTLAYQFSGASISDNRFSASKFTCNGDDELKLRRFWINYDGKQLPSPIPDTDYETGVTDYFTQRYNETLMYTNSLNSPEPYEKWLLRGIYFHFSGYDGENKEDRVFVSSQFDTFDDNSVKPNVLLFDHYIKNVDVHINNHRIENVKAY